jgi:hypothetical protein
VRYTKPEEDSSTHTLVYRCCNTKSSPKNLNLGIWVSDFEVLGVRKALIPKAHPKPKSAELKDDQKHKTPEAQQFDVVTSLSLFPSYRVFKKFSA